MSQDSNYSGRPAQTYHRPLSTAEQFRRTLPPSDVSFTDIVRAAYQRIRPSRVTPTVPAQTSSTNTALRGFYELQDLKPANEPLYVFDHSKLTPLERASLG